MWVWSFSAITLLSLWVASSTLNLHSFSLTATEYYSKQINSTVQDPPQRVGVKCCAKRHFSGCKTQSRLLPSFWWRRLWKNKSGESQILNSICENSWSRVAACAGTFVAPSWPTYFDVWVCVCVCACARVDMEDRFISFSHVNRLHLSDLTAGKQCVKWGLCVCLLLCACACLSVLVFVVFVTVWENVWDKRKACLSVCERCFIIWKEIFLMSAPVCVGVCVF